METQASIPAHLNSCQATAGGVLYLRDLYNLPKIGGQWLSLCQRNMKTLYTLPIAIEGTQIHKVAKFQIHTLKPILNLEKEI